MTETEISLPKDKTLVLRVVPMPADVNINGSIFGGWIMSHVDIAGTIAAGKRALGKLATVAVNSFTFKQPVAVGDLLSFYADIIKTGRTSITVVVEVYAERFRTTNEIIKVTEATLTYVALDANHRPRPLPPID